MEKLNYVAIDFDGTLVEMLYPNIGEVVPHAFEVMKEMQEKGVKLILNTMRSGKELREAVDFCKKNGIEFYGVNVNPTQRNWTTSPKIYAEKYVDDSAVGCPLVKPENKRPYVDWIEIRKELSEYLD